MTQIVDTIMDNQNYTLAHEYSPITQMVEMLGLHQ